MPGRAGLAISKMLMPSPELCRRRSVPGWRGRQGQRAAGAGFGARELTTVWFKHHVCVGLPRQTGVGTNGRPRHSVGKPTHSWTCTFSVEVGVR